MTDQFGQSATATETIVVTAPTLAAVDDNYSGIYGVPVSGNAATADTYVAGSTFAVATPPANGTVAMSPNGTYTYTPSVGFSGSDTFTYTVTDPTGQVRTATDTIIITPPTLIAVDDRYSTGYNTPVAGNAATADTVAAGSVFTVATAPTNGSVAMAADGTYTFTPAAGFVGTATFTYRVTDPTGQSVVATETIVVSSPQLTAVNDVVVTPFNTRLSGTVYSNDIYQPGSVFSATSSPAHGSVTMNSDGTYQYLPITGYSGTDSFSYTITDPAGQVVTATVTITVAPTATAHRCLTTFGNLGALLKKV